MHKIYYINKIQISFNRDSIGSVHVIHKYLVNTQQQQDERNKEIVTTYEYIHYNTKVKVILYSCTYYITHTNRVCQCHL